jgi:hypothetical protein
MKVLALVVVGLVVFAGAAGASNFGSLGYSEETTIVGPGMDACSGGILVHNHDGSFETGYAWQYTGTVPPYYGSLAEAYDLGNGTIVCGSFWVSGLPGPYIPPHSADCYVWDGGVEAAPATVLAIIAGATFEMIPNWPSVAQNDVEMNVLVSGAFTVGYWGNWPGGLCYWFCGADLNGPGGHPWTCIAPGIGYPSGWQDPSVIWGPTRAMGCGVYFEQATPIDRETWGSIKALFR